MNSKIGILYICTGKYDVFWKDFYLSAEKYFLTNHEIHYFIFTDSQGLYDSDINNRIHIIPHEHLGRPDATLMRFHTFLSAKDQLEKMDCLFFCNANLEIKKIIGNEILPNDEEGIVVTQHPGFYNKKNTTFTYERDINSTAYIPMGKGNHYVAGGFNGGKTKDFLTMCFELSQNIDRDREKGIVAIWHDESHINKYILDHPYKLLDSSYLYPGNFSIPNDCNIFIRNKSDYINLKSIGHSSTKGFENYFISLLKIGISHLLFLAIIVLKQLKKQ